MQIKFLNINNIKSKTYIRGVSLFNMRGFTLVESLMAILILTTAIIAPLSLAMQTLRYSKIATEKIEATYMAEEAIEMIYNVKKSAEVYCSDPASPSAICTNYFTDYFLDQNNLSENVIDTKCFGFAIGGIKRFCNFDISNIVYASDKTTKLKNIDSTSVYLLKNDSGLSSATNAKNNFKRSVNITQTDFNSFGQLSNSNSILVTSIVCTREEGECDENSQNKVILQSLIAR